MVLIILLCAAVGYILWQQFGTLPLEITGVESDYHVASQNGTSLRRLLGNYTTITVAIHTKPGATCTAIIGGEEEKAITADEFGNVSWEVDFVGPIPRAIVTVNAKKGWLRATSTTTRDFLKR